jgi:hypothetical protein
VCAVRGACRETGAAQSTWRRLGEQRITRATRATGAVRTLALAAESKGHRIATGSRPESKIAFAHHVHIYALSALLSLRGHTSGRAGRAATGIATCTERIQCGTAGRSTRWGEEWQAWQGSGSMLATMLANRTLLGLLRSWLAAAVAFVRGVFASRDVREKCCPCRPLSWPATCSPVLRVVRLHPGRCLCGCACRRAPADKRIARRGCTWGCRRDRTKNELRAWPGCREPAQRPAHGAT